MIAGAPEFPAFDKCQQLEKKMLRRDVVDLSFPVIDRPQLESPAIWNLEIKDSFKWILPLPGARDRVHETINIDKCNIEEMQFKMQAATNIFLAWSGTIRTL